MTDVETRLRSLRHALADGPTAADLRNRATRRRIRRRVLALVVPLVAVVGASSVWALPDDPRDHVVAGAGDEPSGDPVGTLREVEGVTVTVSPEGRIGDGDVVEVRIEGLDHLREAAILLCAGQVAVSDAGSACDPEAVRRTESDAGPPVAAVEGRQRVSLARVIRITGGSGDPNQISYDCAVEPAGCVLAVGPAELPARAVLVPLTFRGGALPEPVASITPARDLTDGQEVTLVGHDLGPNRAYVVQLCQASPGQVCDELGDWPAAVSDDSGLLETVVEVHAAIYGWQGGIDCVAERCSVVISDRGVRLVELPIAFDRGVVAPVPRLEIDPPGPYTEGQEVTIHGTGFRPGFDISPHLGQCPTHLDTAIEERCAYPFVLEGPIIVGAAGTFTASFRPTASLPLTGSCIGEPGCVFAWVILHGPIGASAPLDMQP